jgi:hypothetical protein
VKCPNTNADSRAVGEIFPKSSWLIHGHLYGLRSNDRQPPQDLLAYRRKSFAKYSIALEHNISMLFGTRMRVKGNKNPSERKNKPSTAPKFTISDLLADPI